MSDRTDAEKAREDSLYRILAGAWGMMVEDLIWGEGRDQGDAKASGRETQGQGPPDHGDPVAEPRPRR